MSESFCSIGDGMLSLEDIAVVKFAILICNDPELKRDILCTARAINKTLDEYDQKQIWNEIIKEKAVINLRKLRLPEALQEKVIVAVFAIGMRMVIWAEYHEGTFGFSREFSIHFLNSSFFTPQGMIDNKKAADELIFDQMLSIEQKYKMACLYCFTDYFPTLYSQISKKDKEKYSSIRQLGLVRFWSFYLRGEVDKLRGEKTRDQYLLEKAVESGSKAAVEYCLEQTILSGKEFDIVYAALEAVRNRIKARGDDWIVFRNWKYDGNRESWVPTDHYVDILVFLLSKMRDDQQIEFLKKDIEGINYEREPLEDQRRSRVLEYLLNWPYQDYFMTTAKLMWEFLTEKNYALLLFKICDMLEPKMERNVKYGEEKKYDYRRLLKEFWQHSPERYKRYVFSKQEVGSDSVGLGVPMGVVLLKVLKLENFSHDDEKNIELILASAMNKEKENILCSKGFKNICIKLMEGGKFRALDTFVLNCFSSKEEVDEFRRELIFTENAQGVCVRLMSLEEWNFLDRIALYCLSSKMEVDKFKRQFMFTKGAQNVCICFMRNDKWNSAESAIRWSGLHEEEIDKLKMAMIDSHSVRKACMTLIVQYDKFETFNKFAMWCFASEEEVKALKKELIFTDGAMKKCLKLVTNAALGLVDEFLNFFFSSEEEITEFKKHVAYRVGSEFCTSLISDFCREYKFDEQGIKVGLTAKFTGGKWEEVEKILTWCFPSEKEISEFKKEKLFKEKGKHIHYELIHASQWEEAEIFFAWLGLSVEEIKELKKADFFENYLMVHNFRELFYKGRNTDIPDYGSNEEAVELLLRWYLTDKETVLEFYDEFKRKYLEHEDEAKVKIIRKNLDLAISQRLSDLGEKKTVVEKIWNFFLW